MNDPKEFSCFDDDPRNSGWGYNSPNPYDNEREQLDSIPDEEYIENDLYD